MEGVHVLLHWECLKARLPPMASYGYANEARGRLLPCR